MNKEMPYRQFVLLCVLLLELGAGLCAPVPGGGAVSVEEEESDPYAQYMAQMMEDLHHVYSAKADNLHAELVKRDQVGGENEETEEEDPYSQMMAHLQTIFNGRTENLHAELVKRVQDGAELSHDKDDSEGEVEEKEEDPYSQMMAHLQTIFNGDTENLHAELVKRDQDGDKLSHNPDGESETEEKEEEDPYSQMMAHLHTIFNGRTENLHAELIKRSNEQEQEEDPYTQRIPQLMADLQRVFDGKVDNLHSELDKRSGDTDELHAELDERSGDTDEVHAELDERSGDTDEVHAELDKRSGDMDEVHAELDERSDDSDDTDEVEGEGEDSYSNSMAQLMADLHNVFDGEADNLHAEFNRALDEPTNI